MFRYIFMKKIAEPASAGGGLQMYLSHFMHFHKLQNAVYMCTNIQKYKFIFLLSGWSESSVYVYKFSNSKGVNIFYFIKIKFYNFNLGLNKISLFQGMDDMIVSIYSVMQYGNF